MRHVDEYRDPEAVRLLAGRIGAEARGSWSVMEVCGGQTHSILKFGLDELLPGNVTLVHGPGCPVCVTGIEMVDKAVAIASKPGTIFCSFGDMLRVPGTRDDLLSVKACGGDVRIVYSPLDALRFARENPGSEVVFFAVGFETTAPANAMAVHQAEREGIANFSVLVAQVLVPPALEALFAMPDVRIDALLAPGHVCTVTGTEGYEEVCRRHRKPIVVTGFEPVDLLEGVLAAVRQLERGEARVENAYARAVRLDGNRAARRVVAEVFEVTDRKWRGIGTIPMSGLRLAPPYARFDAESRFGVEGIVAEEPAECRAGEVLSGRLRPTDCAAFGTRCTPEHPLGATMVSSEGACAAYFHYGRLPGGAASGGGR
jgi:hydrogenase expression/formation protein HypD